MGKDQSRRTIQVVLSNFLNAQVFNLHELFMGAIVATLPLVIIFLSCNAILLKDITERLKRVKDPA